MSCRIASLILAALGMTSPGVPGEDAGDSLKPGLVARYTDADGEVVTTAATPGFFLRPGESIHPTLKREFRAEWLGLLVILEGAEYSFSAGEAELYLDGERIGREPHELDAGRYALRLVYRRQPGAARLELRWKSDFFPEEPIPHTAFAHDPLDPRRAAALRLDQEVERGRALVEDLGCVNCHAGAGSSLQRRRAPVLRVSGSRLELPWIYRWLEDPGRVRQGASMPALLDSARDRRDVAAFLGPRADGASPPESPSEPHDCARGEELYGIIGCRACHDQSDLRLDGLGSKMGRTALIDYLRDPREHDPGGRMPDLALEPDEALALAAYLKESRRADLEKAIPDLASADRRRGRSLVETSGCLACHEVMLQGPSAGEPLKNRRTAPALSALRTGDAGCLAERPPEGLPRYTFADGDRAAIRAFLESQRRRPDISPAPLHASERAIARLRCTACHRWRGGGPLVSLPDRVPALDGVGAKLRPEWLERVLTTGARVRTGSPLRMPRFRADAVAPLLRGLPAHSGIDAAAARQRSPAGDEAQEKAGTVLLGSADAGGLACITCHDFREHRPIADEKGPQLVTTAERLRFDWFRRWIYYPGRIVSGTSMPQFFASEVSPETDRKIDALWAALSLGESMPDPPGLGRSSLAPGTEALPLPAAGEAVVLRFPLPGASAAAIAVGLPRQGKQPAISYCFDAAPCRLVYAWRGGFLDLGDSLAKTRDEPKLVGEIFFRDEELPFRLAREDHVPRTRFRGYRIVAGYPEFRYELDGVRVFERVVPLPDAVGFVREFRVLGLDRPAWFLATPWPGVTTTATPGRLVDGRLPLPAREELRFDVRVDARPGEDRGR